jgi:phosphoribosylformylglycinamidine synthase
VWLLGTTHDELGGSEWAHAVHAHLGGRPPAVDLAAEQRLAEVLVGAVGDGLVSAAHDLSDGGLGQALAEACLRFGVGTRVDLPAGQDPFVLLFSESTARAIVSVPPAAEVRLADACAAAGVPVTRLGSVAEPAPGEPALEVAGFFRIPLAELRHAHEALLPALFEH